MRIAYDSAYLESQPMYVLGFSGISHSQFYRDRYGLRFVGHDSSAALIENGRLVFAVEEERLSRKKHTSSLPVSAIQWGLSEHGLTLKDIDAFAYPWSATLGQIARMMRHHPPKIPLIHWPALALAGGRVLLDLMSPHRAMLSLERALDHKIGQVHGVQHHLAHAACAYFPSGFNDAAVLTVDGQGESESATLGEWRGVTYRRFQSIASPDSIGILYGMVTDFLGMRAAWDEYKVMGMASLGDPIRFADAFDQLVRLLPRGRYRTRRTGMVFKPCYCNSMLAKVFGLASRQWDHALEQVHFDVAAGLQAKLEEVLLHLLRRLRHLSTSPNLCLAGGVFLNSVANGKIRNSGLFDKIYIPPVPGDHGSALGAAFVTYYKLSDGNRCDAYLTPFSGPQSTSDETKRALEAARDHLSFRQVENITKEIAERLHRGEIVGWVQGRTEYGPRALGHRSILANPTLSGMKGVINARIKHREEFRPFAGSVPIEVASTYFKISSDSPYMQFVVDVRTQWQERLHSITHRGTCRVQTVAESTAPVFYELLTRFGKLSGIPILLNTSFNDNDEPIVCTAKDAVKTFLSANLDAMAIGNYLVTRKGARPPRSPS